MADAIKEIRVRWVGDAQDLDRATQQARRSINEMGREVQSVGRQSAEAMQRSGAAIQNYAAEIGKLAGALAGAAAAAAVFWKGISHNAEMESMKLGLATIVSANQQITDSTGKQIEGAQKLAIAQGQVAQVFAALKQDAINTTATMPQLTQAFQAALSPMMAMGASLDQTRQVTVAMVQAMGAMSIPLDQARQEINSILQGQISEDSQLAKNLGLNNEMVKSWREQGKLVDNLLDRLKDFTVAGEVAGKTWAGATSTLADNMGNLLGIGTGGAFQTLTETVNQINGTFGQEAQEDAARWGSIINDSLVTAVSGAGMVGTMLLKGAKGFQDAMNGVRIFGAQFGGAEERSNRINDLIANLPTRDQSPEGIQRAGKLPLLAAPFWTDSKALGGLAQFGGLNGKALEKFKRDLAEIDKQVNEGVAGQVDEILSGWEKAIKDANAAAKANAKGLKIAPRKAAASSGKTGKSSTLGPAIVGQMYGPEQIALPAPTYEARDLPGMDSGFEAWKAQQAEQLNAEILKNQSRIGTGDDPLVKGMKTYAEWKKGEGDRLMQQIAQVAGVVGSLMGENASNGGISGGSWLRGAGSLSSMVPGYGTLASVGLNVGAGILDARDGRVDRFQKLMGAPTSGQGLSEMRNLRSSLSGEVDKRSKESYFIWDSGKAEFDALKQRLGDVDKALGTLEKTAGAAAEAQERVSKTANSFGAIMGVSGLRESLGLGKKTTGDIERALSMSGSGVNVGMLGDASKQSGILSALEGLQYAQALGQGDYIADNTPMVTSANASAKSAVSLLESLGVQDASSKSVNELVTLLQNVLVPAMQDLKNITGGVAAGSISGAGSDNSLAFDAPQTRMITNNNTITVNTMAITGDKASVRELARILAVEMNTINAQAV